jgi:putative ABC transport system permease protein
VQYALEELHFRMAGTGSIAGWIETVVQDLRHAARGLCKAPAFTLVAVLTLALGIGGTTTIFGAIDALLLRPLPYPDQNRLVALSIRYAKFPRAQGPVSATDVAHWRADNRVFEQIECVSWPDMVAMSSPGYAERVGVQHVSMRLLSLLGVKAFLGTLPTDPLTEKRGSDGVAISYEFWQHHFGGDPHVLGKGVFVDTASMYVAAVLSPGFNLFGTEVPEVYMIEGTADPADSGINDPRFMMAIAKL